MDHTAIQFLNPGGNVVDVPLGVVNESPSRFRSWRIRGGPPSELERLQRDGFSVELPPDDEAIRSCQHRPRIAHLWPCPFNIGGAQRFILDIAVDQARWADVHVLFAGDGPGEWLDCLPRDHGIKFHRCNAAADAERLIEELQPALAWHQLPRSRWALDACVKWARHLVGTEHSWGANADPSRPSWVIPITGNGGIRHGIDLVKYAPRETQRKPRGKARLRVGILGRRTDEKLPESFVAALERHQSGRSNLTWDIAGNAWQSDATARKSDRLAAIPHVEMRDTIPPQDVAEWLHSIDVLCIPSITESVCYAAIEAMACGVPVVARSVDGLPDTVGQAGRLVATDAELIGACEELASAAPERKRLGALGRARALTHFDVNDMRLRYAARIDDMTRGEIREPNPALCASVVIPVWNTPAEWLRESVESVTSQHSPKPFEVILVDDGSTDPATVAELDAIAEWTVPGRRIRILRRETNGGVGAALNDGIRAAQSEIIVRHDADDVMAEDSFIRRVNLLDSDSLGLTVVAGQMTMSDGSPGWDCEWPETAHAWDPVHRLNHPTVAFRREAALSVGGYARFPDGHGPEDLSLWCRMDAGGARFTVISAVFTHYRCHDAQESRRPDINNKAETIRREWRRRMRS